MNCKNPWTTEFLITNLNKSYMENEYKKHRKELLVDKEISKTPELMNLAEQRKIIDKEEENLKELVKELNEIKKVYNKLQKSIRESRLKIFRLKSGEDTETSQRKKFIMPCPNDNCKGYLSCQYKCNLCEIYTCPDCFDILGHNKTQDHICKEENLKSAQLIKKETKGCPKCGVRIHKISGCDQMWCTECKVAFSWNTGKIVLNGSIHNPHYYQYMQNNNTNTPRNPGDIICGGLINHSNLNVLTYNLKMTYNLKNYSISINDSYEKIHSSIFSLTYIKNIISIPNDSKSSQSSQSLFNIAYILLHNLHRLVNHITNVDLINCRRKVVDYSNHDHLTVEYILNKKTKEELSRNILRNDNLRKKNTELLNIYELLSVIGIERFNNLYNFYTTNIDSIISQIKNNNNNKNNNKNNNNNKSLLISKFIEFLELIFSYINEFNETLNITNNVLKHISYNYNITVTIINYDPLNYNYNSINKKFKQNEINK
jgi:hypothetical protein